MPASPFTPKTLSFLRALERNNRREWFHAHREEYDAHVRAPMTAFIEAMGRELATLAPELVADPKRSLYRIWRDTRFSEDKRPLKTNAAALFPRRGADRHSAAGLYFEVSAKHVFAGGGLYRPQPRDLQRIRERIATDPSGFRRTVESAAMKRFGGLQGDTLVRVPRGFAADHPAADLLRFKQFVAWAEWPPDQALSPRFWNDLLPLYRAIVPMVRWINEALGETRPYSTLTMRTTT